MGLGWDNHEGMPGVGGGGWWDGVVWCDYRRRRASLASLTREHAHAGKDIPQRLVLH